MKIDWNAPIEAVHEDGRVVQVHLYENELFGKNPDKDGDYWTTDPEGVYRTGRCFKPSGQEEGPSSDWHIRNCTKQPNIDPGLVERMADWFRKHRDCGEAEVMEIADALPKPPVDPDLIKARKIISDRSEGDENYISNLMDGAYDDYYTVQTCLAAIKCGRELERDEK